jgi:hypothetical protein
MESSKSVLFEYDNPVEITGHLINYEAGIWFSSVTPGAVVVTDDNNNVGYYDWTNSIRHYVKSLKIIDGLSSSDYAAVDSVAEVRSFAAASPQYGCFYFDWETSAIYIHFAGYEPPLAKRVYLGCAVGFSWGKNGYDFHDVYYEPRLTKLFTLKKSIDPLFWGVLKFQSVNIELLNADGDLDDWRERGLYAQPARILMGYEGDTYADYDCLFSGFIENDNRNFEKLTVTLQDPRKNLTQPICQSKFLVAEYPYINTDDTGNFKPVAYGPIKNAHAQCLDENAAGTNYTFFIADTTYNNITSLDEVRWSDEDGAHVLDPVVGSVDLDAGTFQLESAVCIDHLGDILINFTVNIGAGYNGVDILVDLMQNYDGKVYIDNFWNLSEVAAAQTAARDTSVYVDDDTALSDVIEQICIDIDARFFCHDDGTYTIKLYDAARTPAKTIKADEWLDDPDISNNSSAFISSANIKYLPDQTNDTRLNYSNTTYQTASFNAYHKLQTVDIETNLVTVSDAEDKGDTILSIQSVVSDVIARKVPWVHSDLEVTNFIIASPATRLNATESWGVYELLGVDKDIEKSEVKLTMRYVEAYP